MTTICAKVYSDRIDLACDTLSTDGHTKFNVETKIIEVTSDCKIAFSGLAALGSVIKLLIVDIRFLLNENPEDIYAIYRILQKITNMLQKYHPNIDLKEPENAYDLVFLLNDKLYAYSGDSIEEVIDFVAIGSGSYFALASLVLGKTPRESVLLASKLDLHTNDVIREYSHKFKTNNET